jgi:hypothetical protein
VARGLPGSLVMSTSPGRRLSTGMRGQMWRRHSAMELMWPGGWPWFTACASIQPRRRERPRKRSPASRTMEVKDVRCSAGRLLVHHADERFQQISSVTGSQRGGLPELCSRPAARPTQSSCSRREGGGPPPHPLRIVGHRRLALERGTLSGAGRPSSGARGSPPPAATRRPRAEEIGLGPLARL